MNDNNVPTDRYDPDSSNWFSIVMPNYNKAEYIVDSVNSVLTQNYNNFELIIIDDGSTDDSVKRISSFLNDERVKIIEQNNQGASAARNRGIMESQYDLIAFLDSDDLWCDDFLYEMDKLIKKYPNCSAYGCAYQRGVEQDTAQDPETIYKDYCITNYFDWLLSGKKGLTASSCVIKRNVFNSIEMFPIGVSNWEDLDLWARIGLLFDISITDKVCAIYRDTPNSMSKSKENLNAPFIANYKDILNAYNIDNDIKNSFQEYVYSLVLESAWQQYLIDNKRLKAIKKALSCYRSRLFRKRMIAGIAQYILTPAVYNRIRGNV